MSNSAVRAGVTLVEVCVIVFVLFLLAGLFLTCSERPQAMARQVQCMNNQRQIFEALSLFNTMHGYLPPSMSSQIDPGAAKSAPATISWVATLFDQLGRGDLAKVSYSTIVESPPNIPLLICPADKSKVGATRGGLSYVVNGGSFKHWQADGSFTCLDRGVWELRVNQSSKTVPTKTLALIARIKGLAQTISHSENLDARSYIPTSAQADYEVTVLWDPSAPLGFNQDVGVGKLDSAHARPSSNHPNGAVVSFCDGSVSAISNSIDYKVYATLMAVDPLSAVSPTTPLPSSDPLASFLQWPLNPSNIPQP